MNHQLSSDRSFPIVVISVVGLVGFALGWHGTMEAGNTSTAPKISGLSAAYQAAQLFVMNGATFESVPFQLHLARLICPVVTSAAVLTVMMDAWATWWRRTFYRFIGNHVIIAGDGEVARAMVQRTLREGKNPLVLLSDQRAPGAESSFPQRVPVVRGDLSSTDFLLQWHAERASHVIAVSDEDTDNLAMASAVHDVEHGKAMNQKRIIRILNPNTRASLDGHKGFLRGARVVSMDLDERNARDFLHQHPLDFIPLVDQGAHEGGKRATLVVIGNSTMAEHLVLQAGKVAHYPSRAKTRLLWVTPKGKLSCEGFLRRFHACEDIFDLLHVEGRPGDPTLRSDLIEELRGAIAAREPITIAVFDGESGADRLGSGLWLESLFRGTSEEGESPPTVQIVPDLGSDTELNKVTSSPDFIADHPMIRPYHRAPLEDSLSLDLEDPVDRIARAYHKEYVTRLQLERKKGEDGTSETRPAEFPWDDLEETYRIATRAAADHIAIKLRSIGLEICDLEESKADLPDLTEEQVQLLARLEHDRWMAERRLSGWTLAPEGAARDNQRLLHTLLVPWDALPLSDQKLDFQFVEGMARALGTIKKGVREIEPAEASPESS